MEEPLEVRLAWRERDALEERPVAVTMRTPGHDEDLALGFLFTEGILAGEDDVVSCEAARGRVRVELRDGARVPVGALDRSFYVTLELRGVQQEPPSTRSACDAPSRPRTSGCT